MGEKLALHGVHPRGVECKRFVNFTGRANHGVGAVSASQGIVAAALAFDVIVAVILQRDVLTTVRVRARIVINRFLKLWRCGVIQRFSPT